VSHSAAATQPAKKLHIFHQWHRRKSANINKRSSSTEDAMVAAPHSEQNARVMRETVR